MALMDFDPKKSNYQQLKKANANELELRVIFSLIHALEPRETLMNVDESPRVISNDFSPTLREPDIEVVDKKTRSYSMWYKPVVYYPLDSVKASMPELFILEGKKSSFYELDEATIKALKTHDFLTSSMMKDLSIRLLSKITPIKAVVFIKEKLSVDDVNEAKNAAFFLKPARIVLASSKSIPENVKANVPLNSFLVENADMNSAKIKEVVKMIM